MNVFSFIVPVYNCEGYLADCVNSVLAVGLNNFEIILVDDGSKDKSGSICDELSEKYDSVKTIHQNNQGVSAARNRGIDEASGEFIVFLDADDSIEPEKFRKILRVAEDDDSIDMLIYGLSFDYYYHGKIYRRDDMAYPAEGSMSADEWTEEFYQLYVNNSISPIWNKVFRKSIIAEHNLKLNESMFLYEDFEFVIRYMSYCDIIYNSTEIVYHYRQTEDEGNAKRRLARIENLSEFIVQIEKPLKNLISLLNCDKKSQISVKSILPSLYLVLATEKISTSNRGEIQKVCVDMAKWYDGQDEEIIQSLTESEKDNIRQITDCHITKLIFKRKVTAIRHRVAVAVKNTRIFKKLKRRE